MVVTLSDLRASELVALTQSYIWLDGTVVPVSGICSSMAIYSTVREPLDKVRELRDGPVPQRMNILNLEQDCHIVEEVPCVTRNECNTRDTL